MTLRMDITITLDFSKKCYIYGYCFFPLWYIGTLYNFSKEKDVRYWAKMCTLNAILISMIIFYGVYIGVQYVIKKNNS